MNKSIKEQSIKGFGWKFFEKAGTQIISMIIQIVLARLLMPEDYGLIGYLALFISISDVFLKQGFTTALIQKKDISNKEMSSVFFINIGMAFAIYILLYLLAPFISSFYSEPKLINIMRVLSFSVVIGAIGAVHSAVIAKNLDFKKGFWGGLVNTVTYGIIGIFLASVGFGVWALVMGRLIGLFFETVVLWKLVKWRPEAIFSFRSVKRLFDFSSKVLGTNLLNTLFNNINSLIIGRIYTSTDLGYYQRGQNIPQTIMTSIDGSMSEVMYPTFALFQDNKYELRVALRRSMKLSMYLIMPILIGLIITAEPLTIILLTRKWLPSVKYMKLMCAICMFWPLSAQIHALNALGLSGITFKISIFEKCITLTLVLTLIKYGVIYAMIGNIISSICNFFITSFYVKKYINYGLEEVFVDLIKPIILAMVMGFIVNILNYMISNLYILLFIQIIVGIILYFGGSVIFKIDSFYYITAIIRKQICKEI